MQILFNFFNKYCETLRNVQGLGGKFAVLCVFLVFNKILSHI